MVDASEVIADLLARGHAVRFQARGDSMHPAIRDDDYLHVEPLDASVRLHRGEIVVMLAERGLTVHRVLAQRGETVLARGDNAPDADPPLARTRVIGRVIAIERNGKSRRLATSLVLRTLSERRAALRRMVRRWMGGN
ncbi:MAG TPA: S24/S26 family peptidase [Thermoanaerobaculia bacterium]|nr:S24/S26 family peptidase [Thermoanaerobaculia bacterium]